MQSHGAHSLRSAVNGSSLAARRAGSQQAMIATTKSLFVHFRVELGLAEKAAQTDRELVPPNHGAFKNLSWFHDEINSPRKLFPIGGFLDQLLASGSSQFVKLRFPVVV